MKIAIELVLNLFCPGCISSNAFDDAHNVPYLFRTAGLQARTRTAFHAEFMIRHCPGLTKIRAEPQHKSPLITKKTNISQVLIADSSATGSSDSRPVRLPGAEPRSRSSPRFFPSHHPDLNLYSARKFEEQILKNIIKRIRVDGRL